MCPRALTGLTRAEQDVVLLVLRSELTHADTATAPGIPIGTVRSPLARKKGRRAFVAVLMRPQGVGTAALGPGTSLWGLP